MKNACSILTGFEAALEATLDYLSNTFTYVPRLQCQRFSSESKITEAFVLSLPPLLSLPATVK